MPGSPNDAWNLESFVDSFIVELDKAQDTLALKGLTRKLTYTVQDVNLDLHIFPQYRDGEIRFVAAGPGEEGASRLSMQLGSITNRQIRDVAKEPPSRDDIDIDLIEELDPEVKDSLKRVGVSSVEDIERMEERNVDLEKVVREKVTRGKPDGADRSFKDLANIIRRSRRQRISPALSAIRLEDDAPGPRLELEGRHLAGALGVEGFPAAALNGRPLDVLASDDGHLSLKLPEGVLRPGGNRLDVALDPYAVMTVDVRSPDDPRGPEGGSA